MHFLKTLKYFLPFLQVLAARRWKFRPNNLFFPVIWVTNRCNLKCSICDQWRTPQSLIDQELKTEDWFQLIRSAKNLNAMVVVITGGEPLLRKDIFEILRYINSLDMNAHLITNGTLLSKHNIVNLKKSRVSSISISLDSFVPEVHNCIRGINCFDRIVDGIKNLNIIAPEIKLGINCVITKKNFRSIYKMVKFAENLGVDQIKFDLVHTNLMHKDKTKESFKNYIFKKDELPELELELEKLRNNLLKSKLITNSSYFLSNIITTYLSKGKRYDCYAGYISCAIDALGYVSVCDNFNGILNIKDKSLEQIWKSDTLKESRIVSCNCTNNCWDTTHGELNIICSMNWMFRDIGKVIKNFKFYFNLL